MATKSVLIVDDDLDILDAMGAIIESQGLSVYSTSNSSDALKYYKENQPQIVFLDLMMEKIDSGITICQNIRKINKDVKIYLISSVGDEFRQTLDLNEHGFDGSISKPLSSEELIKLIK